MTRDVRERLQMYSRVQHIEVIRLALNYDQVQLWSPPENPAKETDSRYQAYVDKFGESSWELDAVEPAQLASLVRDAVIARRDGDKWQNAEDRENEMKAELVRFVDQYNSRNN